MGLMKLMIWNPKGSTRYILRIGRVLWMESLVDSTSEDTFGTVNAAWSCGA